MAHPTDNLLENYASTVKTGNRDILYFKGVGVYNEYYMANLYLMDKKLHTIATSLYTFVGPMGSQYNLICAGVIISLLPALIVFILCQKQIYSGIAAGAVKG